MLPTVDFCFKELMQDVYKRQSGDSIPSGASEVPSMAGRDRINEEKSDYSGYPRAQKGTDPKEVVIGVGAAFQREITRTICDIPLDDVLKNVKAGIEEEGMVPRVVKILDTSDVCFMALEAAKLSGSGIGVGIQSCLLYTSHALFPEAPSACGTRLPLPLVSPISFDPAQRQYPHRLSHYF